MSSAPFQFNLSERRKPGLLVVGSSPRVGKTVVICAIADVLTRFGAKVGVFKPFDVHAERERGDLVSRDAEALSHFAQLDPGVASLSVVSPLTTERKLDPAIDMTLDGGEPDFSLISRSLSVMDQGCDILLIEAAAGLMTPIHPNIPSLTFLDLAREMGYPVLLLARPDGSTLSDTSQTCALLRQSGCMPVGVAINFYNHDHHDRTMQLHREWLGAMNRLPILATLPNVEAAGSLDVHAGVLHDEVRAAVALTDWRRVAKSPVTRKFRGAQGGVGPDMSPGPGRRVVYRRPSS